MDLVLFLEAAQNGDGVLHRGLAYQHRLEAALERGVLFDVLAVFVERCCADGVQLATGKRGLEHVACVERAVAGGASAHDGVQLVDEQDDAAIALLDLAQHRLQAIFELATVLRSGHHGTQVKRDDVAILQTGRHVARHDTLGQAFDDSRLSGAGLADKHGVVFRATGEHLDGAADLLGAADDRVELAFACLLGEVLPVLLERLKLHLVLRIGHAGIAAQLVVSRFDGLACDAGGVEDLAGGILLLRQSDEQMLARGIAVAQLFCDFHSAVDKVHKCRARHAAHHHAATRAHLGHAEDLRIHVGQQLEGLCSDAFDNGR